MNIEKFSVCRDAKNYLAWPDVAFAQDGRLVCAFNEMTSHGDYAFCRVVYCFSFDRGRTWTERKQLTKPTNGTVDPFFYSVVRMTLLKDGRLCLVLSKAPSSLKEEEDNLASIVMYLSSDNGETWTERELPVPGIVPDRVMELESGRWLLASHWQTSVGLAQFLHYSDDQGLTWHGPIKMAEREGFNLCEASMVNLGDNRIVAFLRENSSDGRDCMKTVSLDGGMTWSDFCAFPLPACHRPTAGKLLDGRLFITYRFAQYGKGWKGFWTQNFLGGFTDVESALADKRSEASTRIIPIDFDRSHLSDLGYSGWVQYPDGEIVIVNYIVDDAIDKGQIRAYSLHPEEWCI